jgi:hypothetical protein
MYVYNGSIQSAGAQEEKENGDGCDEFGVERKNQA